MFYETKNVFFKLNVVSRNSHCCFNNFYLTSSNKSIIKEVMKLNTPYLISLTFCHKDIQEKLFWCGMSKGFRDV